MIPTRDNSGTSGIILRSAAKVALGGLATLKTEMIIYTRGHSVSLV